MNYIQLIVQRTLRLPVVFLSSVLVYMWFQHSPSPVTMSTPTGRPAIVGRGQRPQTNDDNGAEDYLDLEDYDEEEDGTKDASMLAEAPTPDLRASIQALASTVASLQLASGRP